MREILFRGQTRRYGEKVRMGDGMKLPSRWVYGGALQGIGDFSIIYGGENMDDPSEGLDKFCVYTDTLGQYTGLTDKNGKKIFEGDICQIKNHRLIDDLPFVIEWEDSIYNGWVWKDFDEIGAKDSFTLSVASICEVIGNIHDPGTFGGVKE
jgi:hypothetical protein